MASSDKKRKSKQSHSQSSGEARRSRALKAIVRTKMKIKRWERYDRELQAGTRQWPLDKKGVVIGDRWDTTGLKSHLATLEGIVKKGKTI